MALGECYKARPDILNEFDTRFSGDDIVNWFTDLEHTKRECIMDPELVNEYDKRFSAEEIRSFYSTFDSIYPEEANSYDHRFSVEDIIGLTRDTLGQEKRRNGEILIVPPLIAKSYDPKFDGRTIFSLWVSGMDAQTTNLYHPRFTVDDLKDFAETKVLPEFANNYDARFSGQEIGVLVENGVDFNYANLFADHVPVDVIVGCKNDHTQAVNIIVDGEKVTTYCGWIQSR